MTGRKGVGRGGSGRKRRVVGHALEGAGAMWRGSKSNHSGGGSSSGKEKVLLEKRGKFITSE